MITGSLRVLLSVLMAHPPPMVPHGMLLPRKDYPPSICQRDADALVLFP